MPRRLSRRRINRPHAFCRCRLTGEPLEPRCLLALVPELLADLNSIPGGNSNAREFTQVGEITYFLIYPDSSATSLWKTDGSSSGTTRVFEFPSASNGTATQLTNMNGTLFFVAGDYSNGFDIWRSDGTSVGTHPVFDMGSGASAWALYPTNVGGTLYFSGNEGVTGFELWATDGTSSGTHLVKDIAPGATSSYARRFTDVGGHVLFVARQGESMPSSLWHTDGTPAGTYTLAPGTMQVEGNDHPPTSLTVISGVAYFEASTFGPPQLWRSDGTASGTAMVRSITDFGFDPYFTNVNGTLMFLASETSPFDLSLWRSDGTSTGTFPIHTVRTAYSPLPYFETDRNFVALGDTLLFRANDPTYGAEFWRSDGSSSGTVVLKDIQPGIANSSPYLLTNVGGTLYFVANDGISGYELWHSNGTQAGTQLLADIVAGPTGSALREFTNVNGTLYFTADDGIHGREPWVLRNVDPPEINVQRAGVNITDGDTTPSTTEGTEFGSATANSAPTYITRQFTIQNTGTGTLNLGAVTTSDPANWSITQQPAATVAPGGSTTFRIRFQPTGGGFLTASVLIPNDDPNENPYDFAVRGYGITPGARIERNNLLILDGSTSPTVEDGSDFTAAGANVSAERVTREFIVKNTGSTTLTLGSVSVTTGTPAAWPVTQQPAASLAPGASTTFRVRFQPTATGLVTGTAHLPTSDPMYGDYTFDIRGVGTDATYSAEIEIRKGSVVVVDGDSTPSGADGTDFGSAQANNTAARITRQFTIYNLGVAPLVLKDPLRVFIDTTTPADWKVTKLPDSVIQPGGSTTFNVRFQPTSAGLKTATIRILNTDGNESPYDFAIQGLGTSAFAGTLAKPVPHGSRLAATDAAMQDDLAWLALRAEDELLPPRERRK